MSSLYEGVKPQLKKNYISNTKVSLSENDGLICQKFTNRHPLGNQCFANLNPAEIYGKIGAKTEQICEYKQTRLGLNYI